MSEQKTMLDLVLLVDDDDTTNYLNKRLLTELQVAKEIAVLKNGREALDYLEKACGSEESPEFKRPDLIFLDIKMPVMDGFTFLDAYQQRGLDAAGHVIILMLTSSASFYDLQKLKNYDKVRKHYSKALTKYDVKEIMQDFFQNK
ncbi:response regulator [Pontibacter harenae]|uniref:response regulator n=1 Tax=Pontibacter harenae TaxID=2894083 RepID=UPI001E57ECEC|nr:response regulator [Pontibacter harenae]MCC9166382.1 response regulator [Pontibacter harenae]